MIKFTYKIVPSKSLPGVQFINWTCKWDGKHNEAWCKNVSSHPFARTFEYQDNEKMYLRILERFKKQKKSTIYPFAPNKSWTEAFGPDKKISRKEAEIHNPERMRKTGDYVTYNPATLALCEMLKDGPNIHKHSGHTQPYSYWQNLLGCLMILWD